jgi:hypothetical protein
MPGVFDMTHTKDEALKLAKECGATTYTNRHYPDATAVTFSPLAWEKFCEQALAAPVQHFNHTSAANSALRDAQNRSYQIAKLSQPAAPVQPVGDEWTPCMKLPVVVHVRKQRPGESHVSTREGITPVKPDDLIMRGVSGEEYPIGRAIFDQTYTMDTTKPAAQRQWVGLTEQEAAECWSTIAVRTWQAIEAKLRSKNT